MPISDKKLLIEKVEKDLANELTAAKLESVLAILSTAMNDFDVTRTILCPEENADSDELLEAFLTAKAIEGRSPKTIERYRYIISKLIQSVNAPVAKMNVYHIRKYLTDCKANGHSDSTIAGNTSVFQSFFGWLHREGLIPKNPTANISAIKTPKKIRLPYSEVEIEKLREACDNDRDLAIMYFLLATGGRISEVCAINRDDMDMQRMECKVLGKGNKERTVYINAVTAMVLARYLSTRTDSLPALFIGKGSERMKPGGVRAMLKRIGEKAGVDNVHPHRFRRTIATNLIDHGMPIQEVAAFLGHDKIDTTMKYIHVKQENVKTSYHRYC